MPVLTPRADANIIVDAPEFEIGSDLGYAKDGVSIQKSEDLYFVEGIENLLTPPKAVRTRLSYTISVTLIEVSLENLAIGWDAPASIAAGPPRTLDFGVATAATNEHDVQERNLTIKTVVPGATTVRTINVPTAVANGPGEVKITQFEEVKIPMVFETVWDSVSDTVMDFSDAS